MKRFKMKGLSVLIVLSFVLGPALYADMAPLAGGSIQSSQPTKPAQNTDEKKPAQTAPLVSSGALQAAPSPSEGHKYGEDGVVWKDGTNLEKPTGAVPGTIPYGKDIMMLDKKEPVATDSGKSVNTDAAAPASKNTEPEKQHRIDNDGVVFITQASPEKKDAVIADVLKPVRNDTPPADKSLLPVMTNESEKKQKYDDEGVVFKEASQPPVVMTMNSAAGNQKIDDGGMVFPGTPTPPAPDPAQKAIENLKRQIEEIEKQTAAQIAKIENQLQKDIQRIDSQQEDLKKKMEALELKLAANDAKILELEEKLKDPNLSNKEKRKLEAEKNRLTHYQKQFLMQKQANEKRRQQLELMKQEFAKKAQERIDRLKKESAKRIENLMKRIGDLLKKNMMPVALK